jgi:hypothetical protein
LEKNMTAMPDQSIVMRLRESSSGRDVWRVQDKDDKAYCIEFESWQQGEAFMWWRDHKDRPFHANHELARVRVHTQADRLMQEAADKIKRLEKIVGEIWDTLYGQNMQVANWHQNGELEPMDTFFESNDWRVDKSA